jgi:predicted nucleic acid-binding protein
LAQTDLLTQLLAISWIHIWPHEPQPETDLLQDTKFEALGAGEQACILLAKNEVDAVVLMSDNLARRYAQSQGIGVVNIPAFLLACKTARLIEPHLMREILDKLKAKDFYEFRADVRKMLLD